MDRVYLDNNATTIVDPLVKDAMEPFQSQMYGNPNSLHSFGTELHSYLRLAVDRTYAGINAKDEATILINGCATEGNNTAIKSAYFQEVLGKNKKRMITSQAEHPSVETTMQFMESLGVDVVYLPMNEEGIVSVDALEEALTPDTALVSIMWANNETGLINPVEKIAALCRSRGVLFHSDAVQAIGKVPVDVQRCPIDYISFSAHKFHGPKGVGALYIREGCTISPLLHGGEQMANLRAGTLNTAGIVGIGLAMELAVKGLNYETTEVRRLRDRLEDAILKIPDSQVIGKRELRTPNTILASFKGIEGEAYLWDLNKHGVAASTGSACSSESLEASATFQAIGIDSELAHTGVRFSLSRYTTEAEIDYTIEVINKIVARLRSISSTRENEYV